MWKLNSLQFLILIQCLISCVTLLPVPQTQQEITEATTVSTEPLIVKSVDKSGLPEEIQMAQCTVTSGDIKASAQAKFSQKLENVCSTSDMTNLTKLLALMEENMLREIQNLKFIINNLNGQYSNNYVQPQTAYQAQNYYQPQSLPSIYNYQNAPIQSYSQPSNYYGTRPEPAPLATNSIINQTYYQAVPATAQPMLKSLDTKYIPLANYYLTTPRTTTTITTKTTTTTTAPKTTAPTTPKTIQTKSLTRSELPKPDKSSTTEKTRKVVSDSNELTYHWKLENFPKVFKIKSNQNEVFSYVFNVNRLELRIRAHMDLYGDMILELEHLANIEDREMNVELFDGVVFKEIATEKLFQYHFEIVDIKTGTHNLISPKYWNTDENARFLIPNSVVVLHKYTKNESIIVKLVIVF